MNSLGGFLVLRGATGAGSLQEHVENVLTLVWFGLTVLAKLIHEEVPFVFRFFFIYFFFFGMCVCVCVCGLSVCK